MVSDSARGDSSRKEKPTHCYLCGRPLSSLASKDHCPPLALFAREIRKQHNISQLVTIPVHENCNASYTRDEEYFVATLVPLARGSGAGDAILAQFMAGTRESDGKLKLARKVLREFELRPGGLHLPSGRIVKRQQGDRIERVAWKIARGLYFHEHGKILPISTPRGCEITPPGQLPPEHFQAVISLPDDETRGRYAAVFDYRFRAFNTDTGKVNYWAFLIWDRIIMIVYSHDPESCPCPDCVSATEEMHRSAH